MSSSCDEKLAKAIAGHLEVEQAQIEYLLERCESPIEKLMLLAFFRQPYLFRLEGYEAFGMDRDGAYFYAQFPVAAGGRSYRLDFAAKFGDLKVAVECDGHDFHERTKEQARRDKRRDRDLAAAGWTVMRFAGSEVYADANDCAWQVFCMVHPEWRD